MRDAADHAKDPPALVTFNVRERLEAFAADRSITLLEVAVGGLAAQPAVASVVAGATAPEQVATNVKAGKWRPPQRSWPRSTGSPRATVPRKRETHAPGGTL